MSRLRRAATPADRPLRQLAVLAGLATVGGCAVLLLRVAAGAALAWRQAPAATQAPGQLLGALCAAAAALLVTWVWLGGLLSWLAELPGGFGRGAGRWSARVAPAVLRSFVAAAVGGSLAIGTATAASASPPPGGLRPVATAAATPAGVLAGLPAPGWGTGPAPAQEPPSPGWTPSRPAPPPVQPPADIGLVSPAPTAGRTVDEHVVVRRGDTLWAIAARHLGRGADAAEIAREWPRWFAANRTAIGADPDVLQPGQLLRPPTSAR